MKKAVCIRDWRPAKLKEGNFRGEHDRDHSNAARSQNFIILNPKYIDSPSRCKKCNPSIKDGQHQGYSIDPSFIHPRQDLQTFEIPSVTFYLQTCNIFVGYDHTLDVCAAVLEITEGVSGCPALSDEIPPLTFPFTRYLSKPNKNKRTM